MNVKRITIHKIEKEQGKTDANLILSNHLLPVNNETSFLCSKLNEAFRKDERVIKTDFRNNHINSFQSGVRSFLETSTDECFYQFTKSSIQRMTDLLSHNNFATGGYYVYIEYSYENSNFIVISIVRDSKEVTFSPNDSDFIIHTINIIKTEKLAMACRIEIDQLINKESRYLQFTHKQEKHSAYFTDWIEAELIDRSEEDSDKLLHIINNIKLPIDKTTNEVYKDEKFRKEVLNLINTSGKIADINLISKVFWNDPDFITKYTEDKEIVIDNKFMVVSKVINQLNQYSLNAGKLKISFSKKDYNQCIIRK